MTDDVPENRAETINDSPIASLHTLTLNLNAMRRLLGRQTVGGELVRADAALIEAAINAGRDEARQVRMMLERRPSCPTDPVHPSRVKLIVAVAEIDEVLDSLELVLRHVSD